MSRYRVVIGGCRYFDNYELFKKCVDEILNELDNKEITILSGHCYGTDAMGEIYAIENDYHLKIYRADWDKYGRSAGPIRNKVMVENADSVIAFWDTRSRGTKNLIDLAKKHNKVLYVKDISQL